MHFLIILAKLRAVRLHSASKQLVLRDNKCCSDKPLSGARAKVWNKNKIGKRIDFSFANFYIIFIISLCLPSRTFVLFPTNLI